MGAVHVQDARVEWAGLWRGCKEVVEGCPAGPAAGGVGFGAIEQ